MYAGAIFLVLLLPLCWLASAAIALHTGSNLGDMRAAYGAGLTSIVIAGQLTVIAVVVIGFTAVIKYGRAQFRAIRRQLDSVTEFVRVITSAADDEVSAHRMHDHCGSEHNTRR